MYQEAKRWFLESNGEATRLQDYEGMHAPVVELLRKEDLALAIHYLNPTVHESEIQELYDEGSELLEGTHHIPLSNDHAKIPRDFSIAS